MTRREDGSVVEVLGIKQEDQSLDTQNRGKCYEGIIAFL